MIEYFVMRRIDVVDLDMKQFPRASQNLTFHEQNTHTFQV
jgi:hypothetical protein